MKKSIIFLVLFCSVLSLNCLNAQEKNDVMETLKIKYAQWITQNIQNYQFTLHRSYMEMPREQYALAKKITVKNGKMTQVKFTTKELDAKHGKAPAPQITTVEMAFLLIIKAIKTSAHEIRVKYHSEYGFPTSVFIDWHKDKADEEDSIRLYDFKVIAVPKKTKSNLTKTFNAHFQQWKKKNIQNYQFMLHRSYMEMPREQYALAKKITVKNGKMTQVKFTTKELDAKHGKAPAPQITTVDMAFELVQKAIKASAHEIRVKYHPEYGFPTFIFIDWHKNKADEEDSIRLYDFAPAK